MPSAADLADRWRDALNDWRIPPEILASAPESPWLLPTQLFVGRARQQANAPSGFSIDIAAHALLDPSSDRVVLDVGVGAGAASLGLRGRVAEIIGVDESPRMLETFVEVTADAGVPAHAVHGRWPDVAPSVPAADVVVCNNVLYNVPDLAPFLQALTDHARSRVVVEITANHPAAPLNPLWKTMHGIDRPRHPTATDAIDVITALGWAPRWKAWRRPITSDGTSWRELVASTGKRLCLGPDRAGDLEAALRELGAREDAPYVGGAVRSVVTIWWDGTAGAENAAGNSGRPA